MQKGTFVFYPLDGADDPQTPTLNASLPRRKTSDSPNMTPPAADTLQHPPVPCPIGNSGLTLLWPFFHPLFTGAGLLDGTQFRDAAAQARAVGLLHYLSTGSTDCPDSLVLLNKVLCGLPPETPVPNSFEPTPEEAKLTNSLFGAVFQNWAAVRSTSVDAFRDTFLLRSGTLLPGEQAWALTIAPQPYDVLLQTLPWSCSIIQLHWMAGPLQVTWR